MAMSNEKVKKKSTNNTGSPVKRFISNILPWKGDKPATILLKSVFIIAIIALIVALIMLVSYFTEDKDSADRTQELIDVHNSSQSSQVDDVSSSEDPSSEDPSSEDPSSEDPSSEDPSSEDPSSEDSSSTTTDAPTTQTSTTQNPSIATANLKDIYALNSDTIGWISIPGISQIDYPVMQVNNNDYYLTHDFDKNYSKAGALFADYRCSITEQSTADNIIIYGHNMANGTFFRHIHDYKNLSVLKSSPIVKFDTLYEESEWKIFAVFLTNIYESQDGGVLFDYHNRLNFNNQSEFNDFYDNVMLRNYYKTDVDVKFGDDIITLSTCGNRADFKPSRVVVMARKVRPGESSSCNTSSYTVNDDRYMPLAWYEVQGINPPR